MSDDPEFSKAARAFLDAQRAEGKQVVAPDQYGFDSANYETVVTASERKKLEGERPTPAPAPSPSGWTPPETTNAQEQYNAEREERIRFLRDRLDGESEKLKQDFDLSIKMKP